MEGFFPSHFRVVVGLALALVTASLVSLAVAQAHRPEQYVVGEDRGWDVASGIAEWSLGKDFKVGDSIWFAYSAGEESVVEVASKEEFDACDLGNPIKMYSDGINEMLLEGEGPRYFLSGKPESCRGGLKLHVKVLPQDYEGSTATAAEAPVPSAMPGGVIATRGDDEELGACESGRLSFSSLLCIGKALVRFIAA